MPCPGLLADIRSCASAQGLKACLASRCIPLLPPKPGNFGPLSADSRHLLGVGLGPLAPVLPAAVLCRPGSGALLGGLARGWQAALCRPGPGVLPDSLLHCFLHSPAAVPASRIPISWLQPCRSPTVRLVLFGAGAASVQSQLVHSLCSLQGAPPSPHLCMPSAKGQPRVLTRPCSQLNTLQGPHDDQPEDS